jgi:quercetin 2,3-dioxygenase
LFDGAEAARLELDPRRRVYLHVARGKVEVNGQQLAAGDALALHEVASLSIDKGRDAEVLVFDLA